MKNKDIQEAIDIEIDWFKSKFTRNEDYRMGFIDGLKQAKEIIERLSRGEILLATKEKKKA